MSSQSRQSVRARAALAVTAAIATLAAVVPPRRTSAHPPRADRAIVLRRGEAHASLRARLELRFAGVDGKAPPLEWRAEENALVADVATKQVAVTLRLERDGIGARLEATLSYLADASVIREAVALRIPGAARAIDRELGFSSATSDLRVDRGTPAVVAVGQDVGPGVAVVADTGIVGMHVERVAGDTDVILILDDEQAHPFETLAACVKTWDKANPTPTVSRARTARKKGDVVVARVALYLIDAKAGFVPVVVERWGDGARAAVVFTDHADRTDTDGLRAVLYGTSDPKASTYGKAGLFGHGLRVTRTFFAAKGKGTLDDPAARLLADEIVAAGSEVGSHSITPDRDDRKRVASGLTTYAPWSATTWIDHQPDTNCEAVSNQGWSDRGTYGVRDLLHGQGFRWLWEGRDAVSTVTLANLFDAGPPIYPFPDDPRLWVFRSSWFYDKPAALDAALGDAELDRLERARGLFVAHVYLSPTPRTTRRNDLNRRNLVQVKQKVTTIDPVFDAALARVGKRVASGSVASLTLRDAGSRLVALADVGVRYAADGSAFVTNRGGSSIAGLTIAIPASAEVTVEGAKIAGSRREEGRTTVWFDLPAGGLAIVRAAKTPLLAGGPIRIEVAP